MNRIFLKGASSYALSQTNQADFTVDQIRRPFRPLKLSLSVMGIFVRQDHISGKNSLGRFAVRRKTIRKRLRSKLQRIKPELRKRMHDPLSQIGQWLKSIVQGHFNYYAVPGNTASLALFRHCSLVLWWHSVRRRSQKRRISWTRMLDLATRWLPAPQVLHPYPDVRFAATHPR